MTSMLERLTPLAGDNDGEHPGAVWLKVVGDLKRRCFSDRAPVVFRFDD